MNTTNLSKIKYAFISSAKASKKLTSNWDIFLFTFVLSLSFIFFCGFIMYLVTGIGFFSETDGSTASLTNNGAFSINWQLMNGGIKISNDPYYNWNELLAHLEQWRNSFASQTNPSDYQQFLFQIIIFEQINSIALWVWLVPIIILVISTILMAIMYVAYKKGYLTKIGKFIFNKYKNIQQLTNNDNQELNKDNV